MPESTRKLYGETSIRKSADSAILRNSARHAAATSAPAEPMRSTLDHALDAPPIDDVAKPSARPPRRQYSRPPTYRTSRVPSAANDEALSTHVHNCPRCPRTFLVFSESSIYFARILRVLHSC